MWMNDCESGADDSSQFERIVYIIRFDWNSSYLCVYRSTFVVRGMSWNRRVNVHIDYMCIFLCKIGDDYENEMEIINLEFSKCRGQRFLLLSLRLLSHANQRFQLRFILHIYRCRKSYSPETELGLIKQYIFCGDFTADVFALIVNLNAFYLNLSFFLQNHVGNWIFWI